MQVCLFIYSFIYLSVDNRVLTQCWTIMLNAVGKSSALRGTCAGAWVILWSRVTYWAWIVHLSLDH